MDGTCEYYLRLTDFRNIDLPLQGIYFIQVKVSRSFVNQDSSEVVPYSASCNLPTEKSAQNHGSLHSLFPPQISPDDSLQSSGFVIQYSDEHVSLGDSFRLSLKERMVCRMVDGKVIFHQDGQNQQGSILMQVDLLFSNASEVGGLDQVIASPMTSTYPTEYTVVASQTYLLQSDLCAEFFRIPLGLLREHYSAEDEDYEIATGQIFPCAFIEGIMCSTMTKLEFSSGSSFGSNLVNYIHHNSSELGVHPLEIEDGIINLLSDNLSAQEAVISGLEIKILDECESSADQLDSSDEKLHIEEEIQRWSSRSFLSWSGIVNRFPPRPRRTKVKQAWRSRLVTAASRYMILPNSNPPKLDNPNQREQILFPVNQSSVPLLHFMMQPCVPEGATGVPGAHLIVLVHGYQGSTHDVRIIRNQVACMCPDALIYSSSANEDHTDGDIESMGTRLVMELRDFIEKHSTSFYIISRVSFITHSLGGLIVRAALPALGDYKKKFHIFLSLSTPHLGVSSKLIEGGIFFLRLFKRSEVLEQLTLKDSSVVEGCYLYRLSSFEGLNWFKRVVFVGSSQDRYSLISSSILAIEDSDDVQKEMASRISRRLSEERTMKIDVEFEISDAPTLDTFIGRAAHIKFLESPVLIQQLILSSIDLFES